jgi:hypothetical protein
VFKVKAKGRRDLVTVVGSLPSVSAFSQRHFDYWPVVRFAKPKGLARRRFVKRILVLSDDNHHLPGHVGCYLNNAAVIVETDDDGGILRDRAHALLVVYRVSGYSRAIRS